MIFSKKTLMGTAFGGVMFAALSSGNAEAASPRCDDIDLTRTPDIAQALTACLTGQAQPEIPAENNNAAPREITPARCDKERNRAINAFETVCRFSVPADTSCPADADRESRVGNRFDPKFQVNDRRVGTRECVYSTLVPPTPTR